MFWWIIWALIFIFLIGSDTRDWASTWTGGQGRISGIWGRHQGRRKTDMEIRSEFRQASEHEVVVVNAGDFIQYPDQYLENLIKSGQLDQARKYRSEMERMAEGQDDDESLRKYAIYGARISKRQKEITAGERMTKFRKKPKRKPPVVIPVIPIETSALSSEPIDPFGKQPTKPPLWSKKGKKSVEKEETVSHLDTRENTAEPAVPHAPVKPPEPPKAPVMPEPVKIPEPPAPKLDLPDFSAMPPGPIELGTTSDYIPGPVKFEPEKEAKEKAEEVEEGKPVDDDSIDPDEYGDLIEI